MFLKKLKFDVWRKFCWISKKFPWLILNLYHQFFFHKLLNNTYSTELQQVKNHNLYQTVWSSSIRYPLDHLVEIMNYIHWNHYLRFIISQQQCHKAIFSLIFVQVYRVHNELTIRARLTIGAQTACSVLSGGYTFNLFKRWTDNSHLLAISGKDGSLKLHI